MKGFLNKVQRRVTGAVGEGKDPNAKPSTPTNAGGKPLNRHGIESTPKADVVLPKRVLR